MNATVSTWIFKGPLWVCACELHAPICWSSQAVWLYVNGNFCLLFCVESKPLYGRREERERESEKVWNKKRETEICVDIVREQKRFCWWYLCTSYVDGSVSLPFISSHFQEALQSPSLPHCIRDTGARSSNLKKPSKMSLQKLIISINA